MASDKLLLSVKDALEKAGTDLKEALIENLIENDKVATKKLIKSIDFKVVILGQVVELQIFAEKYLKNVDEGTEPGPPPPYRNILIWIRAKGIIPRGLSANVDIPKAQERLAWIIRRSIGIKGIAPTNIATNTFREYESNLSKALSKAVQDGLLLTTSELYLSGFNPNKKVNIQINVNQ